VLEKTSRSATPKQLTELIVPRLFFSVRLNHALSGNDRGLSPAMLLSRETSTYMKRYRPDESVRTTDASTDRISSSETYLKFPRLFG
jgi:hypothetical protein